MKLQNEFHKTVSFSLVFSSFIALSLQSVALVSLGRRATMRERRTVNAMRSAVVVLGALAFGYLTLQLGFKPYLERAQIANDQSEPASSSSEQQEEEEPNSNSARHF